MKLTAGGIFHQHVYAQLLSAQIPQEQKDMSSHKCLFTLLGSLRAKAACKMLMKLTPAYQPNSLLAGFNSEK